MTRLEAMAAREENWSLNGWETTQASQKTRNVSDLADEWVPKARHVLEQWLRYRSLPHGLDVEDVVQESLVRGWQWSCVHSEAPSLPLLRTICHNYLVSAYRKASVRAEHMVSLDVVVPYAGGNDSDLMAVEWRLTLEKLLPIRDRQWMWQHYVGGESLATIGNREHVTSSAVKMRLFRARRRLRNNML